MFWKRRHIISPSEEIIVVGMENEPAYKKMDTVVKLDSVSFVAFLKF